MEGKALKWEVPKSLVLQVRYVWRVWEVMHIVVSVCIRLWLFR